MLKRVTKKTAQVHNLSEKPAERVAQERRQREDEYRSAAADLGLAGSGYQRCGGGRRVVRKKIGGD